MIGLIQKKVFASPKRFAQQCPEKERFLKKGPVPVLDPAISCLKKTLTGDTPVFKNMVD